MKASFIVLALLISCATASAQTRFVCAGIGLMYCWERSPARTVTAVCGRIAPWTAEYQKALAASLRKAGDPTLTAAVREAISLRDQARACEKLK